MEVGEEIEEEVFGVAMVAEVGQISRRKAGVEVVVIIEVLSQCTKRFVMNATKVVKFLFVHRTISQYIVMIALAVKKGVMTEVQGEISIVDQRKLLLVSQRHLEMI
jgi:hypothetical protein